ncbi:MFS family permease [Microbacterium terrae]|uniref:Multidrug resistance protein 3 n=1 Tax=Microbacterium terrae TaxID=69369 RepID=A0A0M2H1W4_9MICO|nr:MFS transporter [Microbacterium terrae]KJL37553.1 Multidrug resistance protein 3 [Microbacterium terrae]MBP1076383.1 MFS family permease [Microbacterium terrae]GLJ97207.1 MFS transporter [Microbacterium terrae]
MVESVVDTVYSRTRQNLVVAVLAFAGMGASFMQTILIPIQGRLPELLDAPAADTAWVITATLLASAIAVPIAGKLGDMFGKRRIALVLLAILTVGSIVCALSPDLIWMIVGRALQGMGMGVIPLGIALLRDVVDASRLGTSIALVSATLGVGGALGLPISALVTDRFDWHVLFVFAAVIASISLILVVVAVPVAGTPVGGRVDLIGAFGLSVGLVGLLLAVSQGNTWGWLSTPTLLSAGIGLLALMLLVWYELSTANPLIDVRVSLRPAVLTTNISSVAMGFALFSSSIAFPQLLQVPESAGGLGMELLPASLLLVPSGLAMLAMSPIAGRIQRIAGPKPLLVAGALVLVVAYAVSAFVPLHAWTIAVINAVIGAGVGLGYAAMPALIMGAVPVSETGAANGLNTLMRSFGTTVAAAVVGAILAGASGSDVAGSFQVVFILGLVAAAVSAGVALLIPRARLVRGTPAGDVPADTAVRAAVETVSAR